MSEGKKVPAGIIVFLIFIALVDSVFLFFFVDSLVIIGDFSRFLSFSYNELLVWIDVILVVLSLGIIPYGFVKRKKGARLYALAFLTYSVCRILMYITMTGEKLIGLLLFMFFIFSMTYLLMTTVKRYFGIITMALAPSERATEYTYGLYTLYSKLVELRNGKTQLIYFFSKRKPKSGTPAVFPDGYEVQVSDRSGLPYLKKAMTAL
jgi:hypothetical protein